jgi:hypothetical protein
LQYFVIGYIIFVEMEAESRSYSRGDRLACGAMMTWAGALGVGTVVTVGANALGYPEVAKVAKYATAGTFMVPPTILVSAALIGAKNLACDVFSGEVSDDGVTPDVVEERVASGEIRRRLDTVESDEYVLWVGEEVGGDFVPRRDGLLGTVRNIRSFLGETFGE